LPEGEDVMQKLLDASAEAEAGRLPQAPAVEWYLHTTVDPTLRDGAGNHASTLVAQPVPYDLARDAEEDWYAKHLLSICEKFAPGFGELVVDYQAVGPVHHVDHLWGFGDRLPYATPIAGLYSCSAACHPGGSLVGAAGHNAAARVVTDMEAGLEETQVQPR
jgi:phytoene dehydrogenase-like protein